MSKDLGEFAKLIALLLAILGFIVIYFPSLQRSWETWVEPSRWYWIGGSKSDGSFAPESYYHPNWKTLPAPLPNSQSLVGQVVITADKGQMHIGRSRPSSTAAVEAVYDAGVCLYVDDLVYVTRRNDPARYVWIRAQKVSC